MEATKQATFHFNQFRLMNEKIYEHKLEGNLGWSGDDHVWNKIFWILVFHAACPVSIAQSLVGQLATHS